MFAERTKGIESLWKIRVRHENKGDRIIRVVKPRQFPKANLQRRYPSTPTVRLFVPTRLGSHLAAATRRTSTCGSDLRSFAGFLVHDANLHLEVRIARPVFPPPFWRAFVAPARDCRLVVRLLRFHHGPTN